MTTVRNWRPRRARIEQRHRAAARGSMGKDRNRAGERRFLATRACEWDADAVLATFFSSDKYGRTGGGGGERNRKEYKRTMKFIAPACAFNVHNNCDARKARVNNLQLRFTFTRTSKVDISRASAALPLSL